MKDDTTSTSRPVAEHKNTYDKWRVEELENLKGFNFITPAGYIFSFLTIQDALEFVTQIQQDTVVHCTQLGDKHYAEGGDVRVWIADDWVNKGWAHGDIICSKAEVIKIILRYVDERWITTKS